MSEIGESQKSATKKPRLKIFQTIAEDSDSGNSEAEKLEKGLTKEEVKTHPSFTSLQVSRVLRINTTNPSVRSAVNTLSSKEEGYIGYDLIGGIFSIHMHSEKNASSLKQLLEKAFPFLSIEYEDTHKPMEMYATLTTPHPTRELCKGKQYNPYLNCTQYYFPSMIANDSLDQVPEEYIIQ